MNFFGVGNMELIVVLLVALLVLGPARMVDAARMAGKFWNEAQRTLRSAADAATTQLDARPAAESSEPEPGPEGPEGSVARGGGEQGETQAPEPRSEEPRG
ncbi:MAG: twin-arginine translocase TatA/TatE family subunit [Chloroflexi bacterium]|nr:twin-arginine translocase TatA/TatE family subunit [Chloroflexota bacterium]